MPTRIDGLIREWRQRGERETSLSPPELAELADQLASRAEELEEESELPEQQAFSIATREMGDLADVEREYNKVRKPSYWGWLVSGWGLYVCSWALGYNKPYEYLLDFSQSLWYLERTEIVDLLLVLSNLAMLSTVIAANWSDCPSAVRRWLGRAVGAAGLGALARVCQLLLLRGITDPAWSTWTETNQFAVFLSWSTVLSWIASCILVAIGMRKSAQEGVAPVPCPPDRCEDKHGEGVPVPKTRAGVLRDGR